MKTDRILVQESLQETLWRLEEARQGFRGKSDSDVREALTWVLSRQGLQGSYRHLFAPTEWDVQHRVQLPTGERIESNAAARHILGEEALRTAFVWKLEQSPAVKQAMQGFNEIMDRGARSTGKYCCYNCTVAFLRTLAAVKPKEYNQTLEKGVLGIRKARTADGKWHGFPFYYTLLTLSEIDTPSAQAELRYTSKTAGKLLGRYRGSDRTSRFRSLALKRVLNTL